VRKTEEGQNSTGDNRNVQKVHGAEQMAAERDKENNCGERYYGR